jgi:hypothetical protein
VSSLLAAVVRVHSGQGVVAAQVYAK